MEALYAQAAYCTAGEERARTLLESVRAMAVADETNKWVQMAVSLCQQAVFELETHAIVVDGRIETGDLADVSPYVCQPLVTLEALEGGFAILNSTDRDRWPLFKEAVEKGDDAMVGLWILAGVDPAAKYDLAISLASREGHLSVVERLLQDARVDPSANNNFAIRLASEHRHFPVVERLLHDARVNPSAFNNLVIRVSLSTGHLSLVNRLLQDDRVSSTLGDERLANYRSCVSHLS